MGVGIGDAFALFWIGEGGELGEFLAAAFAYGLGEFVVKVGEEKEGRAGADLLAHEQQGYLR